MDFNANNSRAREKCEPDENVNSLPNYILILMGSLFIWGLCYIGYSSFHIDTYETDADKNAIVNNENQDENIVDGSVIFQSKCAACHQPTGVGIPNVFPPLAESEWVVGRSEVLSHILLHGIQGEITVKGTKYNGMMPAFKDVLPDAEIAGVLTYIRNEWGNTGDSVSEGEVSKVRQATLDKTTPYNGDEDLSKLK
jgi:mono/diheme cytochrome c family protein